MQSTIFDELTFFEEPTLLDLTNAHPSALEEKAARAIRSKDIWLSMLTTKPQFTLFCRILLHATNSFIEKKYTDFDAQTTSNCCHGISLITQGLINVLMLNNQLLSLCKLENLEEQIELTAPSVVLDNFSNLIPEELFDLATLYLLTFIKKLEPGKGRISNARRLKEIAPIGVDFCNKLVRKLQKHLSNVTAHLFKIFLEELAENNITTCGLPVQVWGNYVLDEYIRNDAYNIAFVSCLYSMQVTLAYLIYSKSIVGVVNDYTNDKNQSKGRDFYLLQGNGTDGFTPIFDSSLNLDRLSKNPIIIFGGCSKRCSSVLNKFDPHFQPWIYNFPSLVLACDLCYPQFPKNASDPSFDSSKIIPNSEILKTTLRNHSKIEGVSYKKPSLFCLTHIYTASLEQFFREKDCHGVQELPDYFIPFEAIYKNEG